MIDNNSLSEEFDKKWGSSIEKIIVGTMPGQESLNGGFFYLSNHNSFWKMLSSILDESFTDLIETGSYDQILDILKSHGIALFDVLSACDRNGTSLDKYIKLKDAEKFKNFELENFLKNNPNVKIIFNGRKAEKLFKKLFNEFFNKLSCDYVPSSSNANRRSNKIAEWQKYL